MRASIPITPSANGRGRALKDREAAAYLGVATLTMPTWRARRKGPKFARYGRAIRYFEADLEEYVRAHQVDPEGSAEVGT